MDRRRGHRRYSNHFKPRKFYQEKSEVRKKVEELMDKYGMMEGTALQIATNILPLEVWEAQQREQQILRQKWQCIEKQLAQFSNQAKLQIETAIQILKGAFGLKEYREQKISKMEIESHAEALAKKEQIPIHIAKMVIHGKFTIQEYLARQETKNLRCQKAEEIHRQHPEIAIGTCYAIVDQGITVEEYLQRREANQIKRKEWYRNYLVQHQHDNQPLAQYLQRLRNRRVLLFVSLFHHQTLVGTIIGHTPYEIKFRDQQEKVHLISKLDIKYFCRISYAERVLSLLTFDEEQKKNPTLPSLNPYERYDLPDEILQDGKSVRLTLREGEILSGHTQWFSRYDVKLALAFSPKATVLVFRHAVTQATSLDTTPR